MIKVEIFAWAKFPSKNIIDACLKYIDNKKIERKRLKDKYINYMMVTYKKKPRWYRKVGVFYTYSEAEKMYGGICEFSPGWWDRTRTAYGDVKELHDMALNTDFIYVSNSIFSKIEPYYNKENFINE